MVTLGIAALALAILIRLVASFARLGFGLLLIVGIALVVLGLLGVEPGSVFRTVSGAIRAM